MKFTKLTAIVALLASETQADAIPDPTTIPKTDPSTGLAIHEEVTIVPGVSIEGLALSDDLLAWSKGYMGNGKGKDELCWMNMGWPDYQIAEKPDPGLQACWKHQEVGCCNVIQDAQIWTNFGLQFMKKCVNYDRHKNAWTEEPNEFRNIGCIGCNTYNNKNIIANDGTQKYADTMKKLFIEQEKFSGVQRTLKTDYAKNKIFEEADSAANWVTPNMKTFTSKNGYLKLCASFAQKIARIKEAKDIDILGKPIKDWDRCGMFNIWTTQLDSKPGVTNEYMRWPSREFYDWLVYIEWWGIPNMQGFEYVLVDDVTTEAARKLTGDNCFKGDNQEKGGYMTQPLVGLVLGLTVLSSLY